MIEFNIQITKIECVVKNKQYRIIAERRESNSKFISEAWLINIAQMGERLKKIKDTLNLARGGAYELPFLTTGVASLGLPNGQPLPNTNLSTLLMRMEIDVDSLKAFRKQTTNANDSTKRTKGKYTYVSEYAPSLSQTDSYVLGRFAGAIDGDTINITIREVKGNLNNPKLVIGRNITTRLVGVSCPETKKENGDWADRNQKWATEHNLGLITEKNGLMDKITALADEGTKFMNSFKGLDVVVIPETEAFDTYDRLIGCVYAYNSWFTGESAYSAINVNISIIANASKAFDGFALAEPTDNWGYNYRTGKYESKFAIYSWWNYAPNRDEKIKELQTYEKQKQNEKTGGKERFYNKYGLKEAPNSEHSVDNLIEIVYNDKLEEESGLLSYNVRKGDTITSIAELLDIKKQIPNIMKTNKIPAGYENNALEVGRVLMIPTYRKIEPNNELWENDKLINNIDVPADCQYENYEEMVVDDRGRLDEEAGVTLYTPFHLRIGDSTFQVPPLSIRYNRIASNQRIHGLRSKNSVQIGAGYSSSEISVDLFFPTLESVNGYEYDSPVAGIKYYRNGLRSLIAQFKRAPFLPIENELINDRYGIYSVILRDMEMSTVPGFPNCMQARLTLLEFDHTTYMPSEEDFASAFCWPLYRWYYQRALNPSEYPDRTYIGKLDRIDASIKFKIPDEHVLKQRKEAIYELIDKVHPDVYERSNSDNSSVFSLMRTESEYLKEAKEQYQNFINSIKKFPKTSYPMFYNIKGAFDPEEYIARYNYAKSNFVDKNGLKELDKYNKALLAIMEDTYGFLKYSGFRFYLNKHVELNSIIKETTFYTPLSFAPIEGLSDPSYTPFGATALSKREEAYRDGGFYAIEIKSSNYTKIHPSNMEITPTKKSGYWCIIEPSDTVTIELITNINEAQKLSITDYRIQFEELNAKAHMSEEDIPEVDFPINNIYITEAKASIHNMYVPLQLSSTESPTFQHLGCSDTVIELSIVTKDREAVQRFRELMSTAQRLSREYRIAITSGVISIETPLVQLAGTKSILIERLSVETAGEDKESFLINMSMVSFDKTQRRSEELQKIEALGATNEETKKKALLEYSKRKKNEQGFEYTLIDFALKDLEIYPDLDLPTYQELNRDLPRLGITYPDANRTKFNYYPNPDHAKFVDPDFYIRCEHTFRDYIYAMLEDGDIPTYLEDTLGCKAIEYGPTAEQQREGGMEGPDVDFSQETLDWIADNLETVYKGRTYDGNDARGWAKLGIGNIEDFVYSKRITDTFKASNGSTKADAPSYLYGIIETDKQVGRTKEVASKRPTVQEIINWGYAKDPRGAQDYINSIGNPTATDFAWLVEYLVRHKYFTGFPSDQAAIEAGSSDIDSYTYGYDRISAPKITQEKIINVLKSIFEHENGWRQFKNDGSIVWNASNDLGIGQLNVFTDSSPSGSGILRDRDEVRRAAWIWQYNLERAIESFARTYNTIISKGSKTNGDAAMNPLDWAIVCYNMGVGGGLNVKLGGSPDPSGSKYYNSVMKIFKSKYGADPIYFTANPKEMISKDASSAVAKAKIDQKINQGLSKGSNGESFGRDSQGEVITKRIWDNADARENGYTYVNIDMQKIKKWKSLTGTFYERIFGVDLNEEIIKSTAMTLDMKDGSSAIQDLRDKELGESTGSIIISRLGRYISNVIAPMIADKSFNMSTQYILIKEGAADRIEELNDNYKRGSLDIFNDADPNYQNNFEIRNLEINAVEDVYNIEVKQTLDVIAKSKTPNNAAQNFRKAFKDMLEFDQKGRMVRAFPTYQMFIIDEGRWMAFHKLWDNFYGYNSIASIELAKDRRIAADTAIISMTNIYNNLTMHDNEVSYGEWDLTLFDLIAGSAEKRKQVIATMFNLVDTGIIQARSDELNSMILAPGARIHLRMGYGANAHRLPVVFNGTITEMNAGEMVTVVAQGDGIELCNKLKVKPGKKNKGLFNMTIEPRRFLCEMMASKGGFFANLKQSIGQDLVENNQTSGENKGLPYFVIPDGTGMATYALKAWAIEAGWTMGLGGIPIAPPEGTQTPTGTGDGSFNFLGGLGQLMQNDEHPLGVVHFGATEISPKVLWGWADIWNVMDEEYGEPTQNIYSSAGIATKSQWIYTEGEKKGEKIAKDWGFNVILEGLEPGDEPNVKIDLFNKTPWAIFQTFAHASPDYISTVVPFEFRSSVFFGKPWWAVTNGYKYKYFYDKESDIFIRQPYEARTEALSQFRVYSSIFDIVKNDIKATEEFLYTNVIATYDGGKKQTMIIQADTDIVTEKQKTAIVNTSIEADMWIKNTFTQERYAEITAASALKNYMKDMYQGELIVLGDPTVKPYDKMYIDDKFVDMNGIAEVKRVVHHFSAETGFITCITPDCAVVIDDKEAISSHSWFASIATGMTAFTAGILLQNIAWKTILKAPSAALFRKLGRLGTNAVIVHAIGGIADVGVKEKELLINLSNEIVEWFKKAMDGYPSGGNDGFWIQKLVDLNGILGKETALKEGVFGKLAGVFTQMKDYIWDPNIRKAGMFSEFFEKAVTKGGSLFKGSGLLPRAGNKIGKGVVKVAKFGTNTAGKTGASVARGFATMMNSATDSVTTVKAAAAAASVADDAVAASKAVVAVTSTATKKGLLARTVSVILPASIPALVIDIGISFLVASLVDKFERYLDSRQAVVIMPLRYRGKNFVAGIKGHKGLVAGEAIGSWDKFWAGTGFASGFMSTVYMFMGIDAPEYQTKVDNEISKYIGDD